MKHDIRLFHGTDTEVINSFLLRSLKSPERGDNCVWQCEHTGW